MSCQRNAGRPNKRPRVSACEKAWTDSTRRWRNVNIRLELKTVAVLEEGCFSVLLWDGIPFAVSVERTFENRTTVLMNGKYLCKKDFYHKGGYPTYEIAVEGHDRVLFHKGNVETDSEGCVLVAEKFGALNGKLAVAESKEGFSELMFLASGLDSFGMQVSGR